MARPINILNIAEAGERKVDKASPWTSYYKPLTPALEPHIGRLGVNQTRVPPGQVACPLHTHRLEDEVFIVQAGRDLFRYGDEVWEVGPGDVVACPAGAAVGHQFANPFAEDFIYLAIGMNMADEICTYPDNGKVMVRALKFDGYLRAADYYEGEPDPPRIFGLPRQA